MTCAVDKCPDIPPPGKVLEMDEKETRQPRPRLVLDGFNRRRMLGESVWVGQSPGCSGPQCAGTREATAVRLSHAGGEVPSDWDDQPPLHGHRGIDALTPHPRRALHRGPSRTPTPYSHRICGALWL